MTDLAYLTASDALAGFASKTISPVEVLDAIIARAEAVEPTVNALCWTRYDEARTEAKAAEQRWMDGTARPLEGIVTAQADRITRLESPFHTPVRPSSAPQGEAPQPAAMPVPEGEMFSKGVSGGRRAGRQEARKMWTPPGGQGTNLKYPPSVAGAPFIFNSALPVGGWYRCIQRRRGPSHPERRRRKSRR